MARMRHDRLLSSDEEQGLEQAEAEAEAEAEAAPRVKVKPSALGERPAPRKGDDVGVGDWRLSHVWDESERYVDVKPRSRMRLMKGVPVADSRPVKGGGKKNKSRKRKYTRKRKSRKRKYTRKRK